MIQTIGAHHLTALAGNLAYNPLLALVPFWSLVAQLVSSLVLSLLSAALLLAAVGLAQVMAHALSLVLDVPAEQLWRVVKWFVLLASVFVAFAATYAAGWRGEQRDREIRRWSQPTEKVLVR